MMKKTMMAAIAALLVTGCMAGTEDLQNGQPGASDAGTMQMDANVPMADAGPAECRAATIGELAEMMEAVRFPLDDGRMLPDPERETNRAETAHLVADAIGYAEDLAPDGIVIFTDVQPGEWYAPAVERLKVLGVVVGFQDGTFRPAEPATDCWLEELRQRLAAFDTLLFMRKVEVPETTVLAGAQDAILVAHFSTAQFRNVRTNSVVVRFNASLRSDFSTDFVAPADMVNGTARFVDGYRNVLAEAPLVWDENSTSASATFDFGFSPIQHSKWATDGFSVRANLHTTTETRYIRGTLRLDEVQAEETSSGQEVVSHTEPFTRRALEGPAIQIVGVSGQPSPVLQGEYQQMQPRNLAAGTTGNRLTVACFEATGGEDVRMTGYELEFGTNLSGFSSSVIRVSVVDMATGNVIATGMPVNGSVSFFGSDEFTVTHGRQTCIELRVDLNTIENGAQSGETMNLVFVGDAFRYQGQLSAIVSTEPVDMGSVMPAKYTVRRSVPEISLEPALPIHLHNGSNNDLYGFDVFVSGLDVGFGRWVFEVEAVNMARPGADVRDFRLYRSVAGGAMQELGQEDVWIVARRTRMGSDSYEVDGVNGNGLAAVSGSGDSTQGIADGVYYLVVSFLREDSVSSIEPVRYRLGATVAGAAPTTAIGVRFDQGDTMHVDSVRGRHCGQNGTEPCNNGFQSMGRISDMRSMSGGLFADPSRFHFYADDQRGFIWTDRSQMTHLYPDAAELAPGHMRDGIVDGTGTPDWTNGWGITLPGWHTLSF